MMIMVFMFIKSFKSNAKLGIKLNSSNTSLIISIYSRLSGEFEPMMNALFISLNNSISHDALGDHGHLTI